jgi:hypothetical protein
MNVKPLYYIQQVSDGYVIMLGSEVCSIVFDDYEDAVLVLSDFLNEGCGYCGKITDDLKYGPNPYNQEIYDISDNEILCEVCEGELLQDI